MISAAATTVSAVFSSMLSPMRGAESSAFTASPRVCATLSARPASCFRQSAQAAPTSRTADMTNAAKNTAAFLFVSVSPYFFRTSSITLPISSAEYSASSSVLTSLPTSKSSEPEVKCIL